MSWTTAFLSTTLKDASLALLDIITDHHKHSINDTEHKLQHRTEQLKTKCDEDTAQKILNKTDEIFMKYMTRALLTTNKRLKNKLQNTNTHPKHTTPHNTATHTKTRQTNKQIRAKNPTNNPRQNQKRNKQQKIYAKLLQTNP